MRAIETSETTLVRSSYRRALRWPGRAGAIVVAAFAAGVAALVLTSGAFGDKGREGAPQSGIRELVAQEARHLDSQAPFAVGAGLTVQGVSADGNRFVYRVGMSDEVPASDVGDIEARLQTLDAQRLCNDGDTRRMIEHGAEFEQRYSDPRGRAFRTFVGACGGDEGQGKASLPMAM